MKKTQLIRHWFIRTGAGALALLATTTGSALAQEACLLEPLPLRQRVAAASLIVEARVAATRSLDEGAHIVTLNELEVFKVFRGSFSSGQNLTLRTAGGTVALRREDVTNSPQLTVGQQGVFLLEPEPGQAGSYRLYAGPQGLISYDLRLATAAEPFGHYASITEELYPALEAQTGQAFRPVRTNAPLQARLNQAARPGAAPQISGLNPATITAGTGSVLTITGTGFGTTQGSGTVGFRNGNNGGQSFVSPLASDYVSWSDTEIKVRVPSATVGNAGPAGSGAVLVTNGTSESALSVDNLTVDYALSNVSYQADANSPLNAYRVALVGTDQQGGYTLHYNQRFAANTAAKAAFERALLTWRNGVGANRKVAAATTAINVENRQDNVNVVSFDDVNELPAGVLGVTYSYYTGCFSGGTINWVLSGTDYIYDEERNWQFTTADPTGSQIDFESVVLHEQGHGIQLGHIIKPGAVMHYAIGPNTKNRVLSAGSDVAGGNAEINYSLTASNCAQGAYSRLAPVPLPVTLVGFGAEVMAGGVQLRWRTSTELESRFFAVEATDNPAATAWTELTQVPAAGTTTTPRSYAFLDDRPLTTLRYYRLRQQDLDGTVHYSGVLTATPAVGTQVVAYPNPFTTDIQVVLPAAATATLRLLDLTGRSVYAQAVPAAQTFLTLTPPELRPGVYVLEWQSAGQVQRTRLVKR
ncbi:T9SS type A sorting domain-containing protein [Hymenobacter sp. HSC-4F20]|uniref:T9SS type A sorting domain-containing protein n=1 Tax=Hymenobacter sp. HSC-4F20 TaxID=2864135 RepID=UPI001C731C5B|nr:T9SS type A sorting domain-containing protein [Hymenobacter sp. HSC-4F20]MBX0289211.1 T9SS type A sorting domain-containing protein [Hymenobacter sp. HSC-4F20]